MTASPNAALRQVISADQLQKRIRDLGRQISDDYRGQSLIALGILENGFMFMADLVRALEVPVVCTFIKPRYKESKQGEAPLLEIFSATNCRSETSTSCSWKDWFTPVSPRNT
jgi:hypoxanthine phosphoribosyltransferase